MRRAIFLVVLTWVFAFPADGTNPAPAGPPAQVTANSAVAGNPAALTISKPQGQDEKKTAIEQLALEISSLFSVVVKSLLLLLLGALIGVGLWELRRESVVLYPVEIPKDLTEQGFTSQAIAQRIAAEIYVLKRTANLGGRLEEGYELSTTQLDFTVPGAGISFRGILRYARQFFGRPEQRVQGEIVHATEAVRTVRSEIERDTPVLRITLRTREGLSTPSHLCIASAGDLDELLKKAAFEILSILDPYLIASYWFRKRQFEKTYAAARRCIARTPVAKHHQAYTIWGNALVVARRFAEAEEKYKLATALEPRFASAHAGWGTLERSLRHYDEAAAKHKKALRLDRRQAYVWSNLGNVCNDRHQYQDALRYFQQALRLDPRYAAAWNGEGYALWKLGRLVEAEARLARATDLDPGFTWAYLTSARIRLAQGRYEEAIERVRTASRQGTVPADVYGLWGDILVVQGRLGEAEEMYRRVVTLEPSLANGSSGLGLLMRRQRRFEDAIDRYREATEVDPLFTAAWAGWAETLRQLHRFDEAIEKYRALLAIDPYQTTGYVGWGQVLRNRHQLANAIAKFSQATDVDPRDSWGWRAWGDALLEMHEYRAAIEKFRQAVEVNPRDSNGYLGWGKALAALGNLDAALDRFQRSTQVDGHNGEAWRRLAETLIDLGRRDEAIVILDQATTAWPQEPRVLIEAGHVLWERFSLAERAAEKYRHAAALVPCDADALVGWAQVVRGRPRVAINLLRAAVVLEPWNEWALVGYCSLLVDLGRVDQALRWYRRSHRRAPESLRFLIGWSDALRAKAKNLKAQEPNRERLYDLAEEKLRQAAELHPWDLAPPLALASLFLERGLPERALDPTEQAARLDPNDWHVWARRGEVLGKLHRDADAVEAFKRAQGLRPYENRFLYPLAESLHKLGRTEEAIRQLRRLVELNPQHTGALRLLARLETGSPGS